MRLSQVVVLLAFISGCDPGEDSWAQYRSDHTYYGGPPSVSPDGRNVVFSSPRSGGGDLYRVAREGLTRLTESEDFEAQPFYSPSGDKIAYVREGGGWRHVWVMNADGSNQTQLTTGRVLDDLVGFSPDCRKIYFTRAMPSSGPSREAVYYVMDADGQNLHPNPPGSRPARSDEYPSADGRFILAFGPYGSSAVRVLTSDTREEMARLKIPPGLISRPALSHDAKTIVFSLLEPGVNDVAVYLIRRDRLTLEKLR